MNGNGTATRRAPEGSPHERGNNPNPFTRIGGPSIALSQLYERTSRSGRRYLVGRLGSAKVFVVATGADSHGNPIWQMYLGETKYVPQGAAALAREVEAEGQAG
jgi:hypothetical protein